MGSPDTFRVAAIQDVPVYNPGLSMIVDPDGKIVAGPLEAERGILYADVAPDQLVGPRWQLDGAGHYARPDVFELRYHRRPTPVLQTVEGRADASDLESSANGGHQASGEVG